MATELRVRHEFDCDVERYWRMFFDDAYNAGLYRELKVRERTLLEQHDEGGGALRRRVRVIPDVALPGPVRAVAGDNIGYVEHGAWRPGGAYQVTIEPLADALRGRFTMAGTYAVAPAGAGRVAREFSARIEVKVPFLGGQIEKLIADDLRKSYETATAFTRRWLAEHPAA